MISSSVKYLISLFVLFVLSNNYLFAQGEGKVWRKTISREIDVSEGINKKYRDNKKDTSLFEYMVKAIAGNQLSAYLYYSEHRFANKDTFTMADLEQLLHPLPDTIDIVDPTTNKEEKKIVLRDFNCDSVHKYRIYEEWVFIPATGETEVQIIGIAPIRKVYGGDGVFRGSTPIFLLTYNDALTFIEKVDEQHVDNSVTQKIWMAYFARGIVVPKNKDGAKKGADLYTGQLVKVLDGDEDAKVFDPTEDIREESQVASLPELFFDAIDSGKLNAYSMLDYNFVKMLTTKEVNAMIYPQNIVNYDSSENEPFTSCVGGISFSSINFIHRYAILEGYYFEPKGGKLKIQTVAVAPIGNMYDPRGNLKRDMTMFWLKYKDISKFISQYEEYYPMNTISDQIWNSYFLPRRSNR
jgi:hypothetical protein